MIYWRGFEPQSSAVEADVIITTRFGEPTEMVGEIAKPFPFYMLK